MRQWREIVKLDEALHKKLRYVDDELAIMLEEEGRVLHREKRFYLEIGVEETAYRAEALYYYPLVVSYYPAGKVFGALLEREDSIESDNRPVVTIPGGSYLIAYHKGPYTAIYGHQDEIIKAHPDLEFTGDIYTFDIVDQMNCANIDDFITKMEFHIKT